MNRVLYVALAAAVMAAAAVAADRQSTPNPYGSTYQPPASPATVIRNATILTAAGPAIERGSVLLRNGKVAAVGQTVDAPADAVVIDATGKWVTPGVIDTHSHLGVYAAPGIESLQDGNEMTNPNTAEVSSEHAIWPQDPQFELALAGGVTTMHILPGSGNLFGGRSVTVKNVQARTADAMKFPGAPYGLKMACGENPMRVYGGRNTAPSTRMGNVAGYRKAWQAASEYRDRWRKWKTDGADPAKRPDRNLQLETLMGVLDGEIRVQNHCYRADEMATMIDISKEFGFKIASFHHAVEAYKIRDLLAANDICASMWADWWGFKLEAYDGITQNIALVHEAGGCAIVHSDSADGIQRLNQEAAKAIRAGADAGIAISQADAVKWISINPAKALGIEKVTGSLEPGKNADVVIWSGDPFSAYAHADRVFIDGAQVFDRADKREDSARVGSRDRARNGRDARRTDCRRRRRRRGACGRARRRRGWEDRHARLARLGRPDRHRRDPGVGEGHRGSEHERPTRERGVHGRRFVQRQFDADSGHARRRDYARAHYPRRDRQRVPRPGRGDGLQRRAGAGEHHARAGGHGRAAGRSGCGRCGRLARDGDAAAARDPGRCAAAASDLLAAMRLADEFKVRLVIVGASEGWMVAEQLAKAKVPVVVKPLTNIPTFDSLGATLENAARLSRAGVTVALASFDTQNSRNLRQEAGNAIANGMDRDAALKAVTLTPAQLWGVADRVGSLEIGKDADVVIWSGDPFELTTGAERVFIKGVEVPRDTRQKQLLDRYRRLPR